MGTSGITLTYINIRQSIVILLAKILVIDLIMALIIVGFYFGLIQGGQITDFAIKNSILFLLSFGVMGTLKIAATVYVILQWLNEYYEITPEAVVHKKGIIFRKTEIYELSKVRMIDVEDSFLGEIFNYATITLYDLRLRKYMDMYLIHNPQRYAKILKTLRPNLELRKDRVHLPFMPSEEAIGEEYSIDT